MIAVVCAVPAERRALAGLAGPELSLHLSGMGAAAAERTASSLIDAGPAAVISAGFCGALADDLRVGDLVVARRVLDERSGDRFAADARLLEAAPGRRGVIVSAERIARTPADRARLDGLAVDLESAAIARVAGAAGIPFLALRAVTDERRHRMPDFDRIMDAAGRLTPARAWCTSCCTRARCRRSCGWARPCAGPATRCARGWSGCWGPCGEPRPGDRGDRVHRGHVAEDLLANGWEVRALVRPESLGSGRIPAGCEPAAGDLLDAVAVRRAVSGVDAVFHVAARYSLARSKAAIVERTNTDGTANVLTAAAHEDVPMVHCSSVATVGLPADGRPGDEDTPLPPSQVIGAYKRSKVESERLALDAARAGQHVVIVNPTAPVGPGDHAPTPTGRIVTDFLAGRMPAYVDTGLNLVDVRDVAAGHRLALERGASGRRYILGNENLTLREILARAGRPQRAPGAARADPPRGGDRRGGRRRDRRGADARPRAARPARRRPHGAQAHVRRRLAGGARAGDAAVAGAPGARRRDRLGPGEGRMSLGALTDTAVHDEARVAPSPAGWSTCAACSTARATGGASSSPTPP